MIFAIAAAIAAAAPAAAACPDVITPDALVCRALEAQKNGNAEEAAQSFEEAAKASSDKDPRTARMWAAAGNLWITANQPGKAALDLDRALAMPGLEAEQRGEALLDRARAAEAQDDLKTARAKANEAAASISERSLLLVFLGRARDPRKRPATAKAAIGKALTLAPSDPGSCSKPAMSPTSMATTMPLAATGCARPAAIPTGRSARLPQRRSKCWVSRPR